jgi:hypothetical protein
MALARAAVRDLGATGARARAAAVLTVLVDDARLRQLELLVSPVSARRHAFNLATPTRDVN